MEEALKEARRKWMAAEAKLAAWQVWAERQISLGLMDAEQAPICFDRTKNSLKEMIETERTIGSHCHYCNHKFEPGERKETTNRIMFFHPGCDIKFEKAEEQALNRQDKY
jgi:hypothetical protein